VVAAMAGAPGSLSRWEVSAVPVVGIGVPAADRVIGERAEQVLRAVRPDVVHLHAPGPLGTAPAEAALRLRHRTVISAYGTDGAWPARTLQQAAHVLAGGPRQARDLTGIGAERVRIVHHGAAPPESDWHRPEHGGPLRLAYLGGMSDDLGYGTLLSALRHLRRTDYELHVVDRATARGTRSIREWDFQVPGLVRLAARFPPTGRDAFFGRVDVLISLPRDPHSACLSVREAMLRGVWPIASHVEGAEQVVEPGKHGTLVPAGDPQALAGAVAWALDNPAALDAARRSPSSSIPTVNDQVAALAEVYQG